jgi:hypothetical protein
MREAIEGGVQGDGDVVTDARTELRTMEGGPLDGQTLAIAEVAHVLVYPVMRRDPANVRRMRDPGLSYDTIEYRRSGDVFRWEGLINDAVAQYEVTAEAFREPIVRRELRRMLRRNLERLDPDKEVDRIVWVVGHDPLRSMFHVGAAVGGRRGRNAAALRSKFRDPWSSWR